MKKYLLLVIVVLAFSIVMTACDEDDRNDDNNKSSKSNIFADLLPDMDEESDDENTDEIFPESREEETVVIENNKSSWVEFDECFYGEYFQKLPIDDGVDANGKTIWGSYDGTVIITEDYIYIDVPNAKTELTPENSRLFGDNFLSVNPNNEDWSFVIHNKENLQAGYKYICIQTANNQYKLNKN